MNHKSKILLVDDEEEILKRYGKMLSEAGYEVVALSSAELALKILDEQKIDLILSDINLPNMNGLDLLSAVRVKKISTKVILMTGYTEQNDAFTALDHGCFGFLAKPLSKQEILRVVSNALSLDGAGIVRGEEFASIAIDDFISGKKANFPIYVSSPDKSFSKLAHSGSSFNVAAIRALKSEGIDELWIKDENLIEYMAFVEKIITAAFKQKKEPSIEIVNATLHLLQLQFEAFRLFGISIETMLLAQNHVLLAVDVFNEVNDFLPLFSSFRHSRYSISRSAATEAFLTCLVCQIKGFSSQKPLWDFVFSTFIHDVGMLMLPEEIRNKSLESMNTEELNEYRRHPFYGHEALKELRMVPKVALRAALEHHEDGTDGAFPLKLQKSHVAICSKSIYDITLFMRDFLRSKEVVSPKELMMNVYQRQATHFLDVDTSKALFSLASSKTVKDARYRFTKVEGIKIPRLFDLETEDKS